MAAWRRVDGAPTGPPSKAACDLQRREEEARHGHICVRTWPHLRQDLATRRGDWPTDVTMRTGPCGTAAERLLTSSCHTKAGNGQPVLESQPMYSVRPERYAIEASTARRHSPRASLSVACAQAVRKTPYTPCVHTRKYLSIHAPPPTTNTHAPHARTTRTHATCTQWHCVLNGERAISWIILHWGHASARR